MNKKTFLNNLFNSIMPEIQKEHENKLFTMKDVKRFFCNNCNKGFDTKKGALLHCKWGGRYYEGCIKEELRDIIVVKKEKTKKTTNAEKD